MIIFQAMSKIARARPQRSELSPQDRVRETVPVEPCFAEPWKSGPSGPRSAAKK